ncbi:MAG: zinc ribbon domain-containing protein [Selenomonas sp.]|nr:zinc ribbon domain-containing protein [Selenomonas sp.]
MKFCEKCQKEYPDDAQFCKICGSSLKDKQEATFCSHCGAKLGPGSQFCTSCGQSVGQVGDTAHVQKSSEPVPAVSSMPVDASEKQQTAVDSNRQISSEGIVLQSGAPLPSKTAWCKWGYLLSLILAVPTHGTGFLLALVVYFLQYQIISFQRAKIRRMKFKFVSPVTLDEIYSRLQPALQQKCGNTIKFDREDDSLVIEYDSVLYDINLNDDGTVSIWWRKTLSGALFSFRDGKLYRKIRTGTALIAYELQQQFDVHA